jgi:hypothetical protein
MEKVKKQELESLFVEYKQAVALKELGFDEPCLKIWEKTMLFATLVNPEEFKRVVSERYTKAPLYQQAFRWMREKHKLHSTITSISQESWQWHITKPGESLGKMYQEDFYTYEEAEQVCLDKLIEICKNK